MRSLLLLLILLSASSCETVLSGKTAKGTARTTNAVADIVEEVRDEWMPWIFMLLFGGTTVFENRRARKWKKKANGGK